MIYASPSYADWTFMGENSGAIGYLDSDRIRKHDGYTHFWTLIDFANGGGSVKTYIQLDCGKFRYKYLSVHNFKMQMGKGTSNEIKRDFQWKYPLPDSGFEETLENICNQ